MARTPSKTPLERVIESESHLEISERELSLTSMHNAVEPPASLFASGSLRITTSKRWRPGPSEQINELASEANRELESLLPIDILDDKRPIVRESSQEMDRSSRERTSAHMLLRTLSKRGDAFDPSDLFKAQVLSSSDDIMAPDSLVGRISQNGRTSFNGSAKKFRPSLSEEAPLAPEAIATRSRPLLRRVASRRGDAFDPSSFVSDSQGPTTSLMPSTIHETIEGLDESVSSSFDIIEKSKKVQDLQCCLDEMEKRLSNMDLAYEIAADLLKAKEAAIVKAENKLELALVALNEATKAAEEARERRQTDEKASQEASSAANELLNDALRASEQRASIERVLIELERRKATLEREL